MDLAVAICTYNPRREYLRRTLDALRRQSHPREKWELLVIDNNSEMPVAGLVDLSWHPRGRVVVETEQGLTQARARAVRETDSALVVFVDDDNELDADYLEVAASIAKKCPWIGVFGAGEIRPEFEEELPGVLRHLHPALALRTLESDSWSNDPLHRDSNPWGAGLCVRREVAEVFLESVAGAAERAELDRRGGALLSGGDLEFSWLAAECGMGKGTFVRLGLNHLIPAERVQRPYLRRLMRGHMYSNVILLGSHCGAKSVKGAGSARDLLRLIAKEGPRRLDMAWARWKGRREAYRRISGGR